MTNDPIIYEWNGSAMVPLPPFARRCEREFDVGERYRLAIAEDRSEASHNHYFARLHELWMNLPELHALRFPTDEHLRKWALIQTGHHHCTEVPAASPQHAQ